MFVIVFVWKVEEEEVFFLDEEKERFVLGFGWIIFF
jgi:hypothetical protein